MSAGRPMTDGRRAFETHLGISALTESGVDYPTSARQYAVEEDGCEPTTYGDQHWVRAGADLDEGRAGRIVERDLTIAYGPWRPVGTAPVAAPTPSAPDLDQELVDAVCVQRFGPEWTDFTAMQQFHLRGLVVNVLTAATAIGWTAPPRNEVDS
jgi:hypothetical protein